MVVCMRFQSFRFCDIILLRRHSHVARVALGRRSRAPCMPLSRRVARARTCAPLTRRSRTARALCRWGSWAKASSTGEGCRAVLCAWRTPKAVRGTQSAPKAVHLSHSMSVRQRHAHRPDMYSNTTHLRYDMLEPCDNPPWTPLDPTRGPATSARPG